MSVTADVSVPVHAFVSTDGAVVDWNVTLFRLLQLEKAPLFILVIVGGRMTEVRFFWSAKASFPIIVTV